MDVKVVDRILELAPPNQVTHEGKLYVDKGLHVIQPPEAPLVNCMTLQGLVDLLSQRIEDVSLSSDTFVHIESPTSVAIISRKSDTFGRRQVFARTIYPKSCTPFAFGTWHNPENFIIAAQQSFQRVKIEQDDGSFAKDLDYVLGIASSISAESIASNDDDGIAQRVALKQGVVLKTDATLRPLVSLAPYRTFAEIDQVISKFVFRARIKDDQVHLALFEGDGGRWCLGAVSAIKTWLAAQIQGVPIIS
jgi:hypothetical protein